MNGPEILLQSEDRWITRMGAAISQDPVMIRNRKLHGDLSELSWLEVFLFGITGRNFNPQELRLLNAMWTLTSYPDPRIWNNRIAALAGTVRSTGSLAVGSALAVSEADIYGVKPVIKAMDSLKKAGEWVQKGNLLDDFVIEELKKHRKLAGFGRPKLNHDERIEPMLDLLSKIGLQQGPNLKMAFNIENVLQAGRWRFRLNYAGLVAGLCADIGLTTQEAYLCMIPGLMAGSLPCYLDAIEHPKGSFFPMRCSRINYEGPERRSWG